MAEVVLFHHAQGLTPGVVAFADELRRAGHTVHTPDLFDGRTFATLEEGWATPRRSASARSSSAASAPSRGCRTSWSTPASPSACSRPRSWPRPVPARAGAAVLLLRAGLGVRRWPTGCRCRCTAWTPTRSSSARATSTPPASSSSQAEDAELFLYPGDQHYFADSSLPSYDADATALLTQRVLDFLRTR